MVYSLNIINNVKWRKQLSIALIILLVLASAFYFQCYCRQVKLTELYYTVIDDFFSEAARKEKVVMLITENAYGINSSVKRQVANRIKKYDIQVMERAIPPTLFISSDISNDRGLSILLSNLLNRRIYIKVILQKKIGFDMEEVIYQMRYSKGKWKAENVISQKTINLLSDS